LEYHEKGLEAFSVDGRCGGNNRIMNDEESAEFLYQFETEAREGKVITIEQIANALDEKTGKERKSLSTAYSFLHRHGWRKVMPRSKHPNKASDEEIESSKKLTAESKI
jgi:transposase